MEPLVLVLWLFFSFTFVKPSATGSEARVVFWLTGCQTDFWRRTSTSNNLFPNRVSLGVSAQVRFGAASRPGSRWFRDVGVQQTVRVLGWFREVREAGLGRFWCGWRGGSGCSLWLDILLQLPEWFCGGSKGGSPATRVETWYRCSLAAVTFPIILLLGIPPGLIFCLKFNLDKSNLSYSFKHILTWKKHCQVNWSWFNRIQQASWFG